MWNGYCENRIVVVSSCFGKIIVQSYVQHIFKCFDRYVNTLLQWYEVSRLCYLKRQVA